MPLRRSAFEEDILAAFYSSKTMVATYLLVAGKLLACRGSAARRVFSGDLAWETECLPACAASPTKGTITGARLTRHFPFPFRTGAAKGSGAGVTPTQDER